jgi:hypothetical protein
MDFPMPNFMKSVVFLILTLIPPLHAEDIAPMHGMHEWVAGMAGGYVDGRFDTARFGRPAGILFDSLNDRLLVADPVNSVIRTVDLAHANQVGTLGKIAGSDANSLNFVSPTSLTWVKPGETVAILDPGCATLAVLDLNNSTVVSEFIGKIEDGSLSALSTAKDICNAPGGFLVSSSEGPRITFFSFEGHTLSVRKSWTVMFPASGKQTQQLPSLSAIDFENGYTLGVAEPNKGPRYLVKIENASTNSADLHFSGTDSELPVSLTASPLNLGDSVSEPSAFVRGGEPFNMVTRCPYLAIRVDPATNPSIYWKKAVYDNNDRILGLQDTQIFDRWSKPIGSDSDGHERVWLSSITAAACDPLTKTWYLSDAGTGRIMSFRTFELDDRNIHTSNSAGYFDWDFPVNRRPEVTRIGVMNLSRLMMPTDTLRRSDSFSRKLEHFLNTFRSLQGNPNGYEVYFIGSPYSWEPDGFSCLGQLRKKWDDISKAVNPDQILVVIGPADLYQTTLDYRMRKPDSEGMPDLVFDPEFAASPKFSELALPYREIVDYVKSHESTLNYNPQVDKKGGLFGQMELSAGMFASNDFLFERSYALVQKYLNDLTLRANGTGTKKKVKMALLFYPDCNGISIEESSFFSSPPEIEPFRTRLSEDCRRLGWDFIDISSPMRVLASDDPFMMHSNLHPNARGQEDLALITAWKLLVSNKETVSSEPQK